MIEIRPLPQFDRAVADAWFDRPLVAQPTDDQKIEVLITMGVEDYDERVTQSLFLPPLTNVTTEGPVGLSIKAFGHYLKGLGYVPHAAGRVWFCRRGHEFCVLPNTPEALYTKEQLREWSLKNADEK